jgi:NADH-quinone oxidoreductase subunit N
MDYTLLQSFRFFVPEIVLVVGVLAVIIVDLIVSTGGETPGRGPIQAGWPARFALVTATAAILATLAQVGESPGWLFSHNLVFDHFAVFFRVVLGLATFAAVWMSMGSRELRGDNIGEYYALLLASALSMFLMAAAANLLMAYLSLEFLSLTSYALTGFKRHDRRASEAALKYLIYGGVASGAMIYGMSWVYGLAGSMDYTAINAALTGGQHHPLPLFVALMLIFAGFGYKIAAVPFHMWAPDVYTGAPIPFTAFLAVGSKAAGFGLLIRFFYPAVSQSTDGQMTWTYIAGADWPQVMLVVSMVTMTLGNLAALHQTNMKRLLAYSGIAHAGYILMGFVVLSHEGLSAMLFYLVVYYLMNLGAFWVVMVVANSTGAEDIDAYRGLASRGGAVPAVALAIFLFSLTGLPPLAGFIGKFYLFAAVIKAELYFLAVVGVLNSVVSLYYYVRPVRAMFLEAPVEGAPVVRLDAFNGGAIAILCIFTLYFGIFFGPLIDLATASARFWLG